MRKGCEDVNCDSNCGPCCDRWSRALASSVITAKNFDLAFEVLSEREDDYWKIFPENSARPLSNADKIRKMSDEELAHLFIEDYWGCFECPEYPVDDTMKCDGKCEAHCLDWLREEAKC